MRAVAMHKPGNVTVEKMPIPSILEHTDAIIKLAVTCICGSDLWPYRGEINPGAVFSEERALYLLYAFFTHSFSQR